MAFITITLTETIEIPDDAEISTAPAGAINGFMLSDGRLVRPWIVYEIEEEDGSVRDLGTDELQSLDIGEPDDTSRHIEHVNL